MQWLNSTVTVVGHSGLTPLTVVGIVAKFRKLGVEAGLTRKIYTSSKIESYICTTFLLLSNHWSSGKIMSFMGLHAKMALLLSFRMFTISVDPESR